MRVINSLVYLAAVTCLAALTACGGSGPELGGGIGGTGKPILKVGPVTAVSSLTVGSVTFATTATDVLIGGTVATPADIQVGMIARVSGTDDAGVVTANSVVIEEVVKGILEAKIDATTLTVQGQTVLVDAATLYGLGISPASPDGLNLGDPLEIYGFVKSPGVVTAARIERESSLSEFRLIGFAASVDQVNSKFSIGTQVIDYLGSDTSDLPGGHPANGQLVKVRGLNMLNGLGELQAVEVKTEDLDDAPDNDDTEIEGFIQSVISPTQFVVAGVTVNTNASTVYEDGVAADVVVGARVEVDGALVSSVLTARKIEFKSGGVRIEADIDTVIGNTLTFVGLPGLMVTVNAQTAYDGNASSLGDLVSGDHVRIEGGVTGPNSAIASEIDERSADTDIRLRGPVSSSPAPSDPTLSILGIPVDTTGWADSAFRGDGEVVIGRAAFFAAAVAGTEVEVQGDLVGATPAWNEIEVEGDD